MGIEPTTTAWKAVVLPLNYTRDKEKYFLFSSRRREKLKICKRVFLTLWLIIQKDKLFIPDFYKCTLYNTMLRIFCPVFLSDYVTSCI